LATSSVLDNHFPGGAHRFSFAIHCTEDISTKLQRRTSLTIAFHVTLTQIACMNYFVGMTVRFSRA
jgi:hypothetical protein